MTPCRKSRKRRPRDHVDRVVAEAALAARHRDQVETAMALLVEEGPTLVDKKECRQPQINPHHLRTLLLRNPRVSSPALRELRRQGPAIPSSMRSKELQPERTMR